MSISPKTSAILSRCVSLVVVVGGMILLFLWFIHNDAQDAIEPFEKVLIDGGAVRKCGSGDPGRGPDNYRPHYQMLYELATTKENAVRLIEKSASQNGYSLTHESSSSPYVDWYSGAPEKKPKHPSSTDIQLGFTVYSNGEHAMSCDGERIRIDSTHTAISLDVSLSSSK